MSRSNSKLSFWQHLKLFELDTLKCSIFRSTKHRKQKLKVEIRHMTREVQGLKSLKYHEQQYEISNHEFVVPLKPARKILERGTWFDTLEAIKLCNYIQVFNLFFQSDAFFEVTWWWHLNFHRIWQNLNFSKNTQETHAKISHMFDTLRVDLIKTQEF